MTDRLREIIDEFQGVPDEFRLEMLVERARQFPPLPERYQALREKGLGRVHECMAEVYFFPEVQDGAVRIHADIPGDAPTQRALVGILMDAYDGASPEAVAFRINPERGPSTGGSNVWLYCDQPLFCGGPPSSVSFGDKECKRVRVLGPGFLECKAPPPGSAVIHVPSAYVKEYP